jgi:DNA-directed RNA polymerase specialized sigma24 family protein
MTPGGSVTNLLRLFKVGDPDAARRLWDRYCRRLLGLARTRLQGVPRRAADEEDVVLSAFNSFCRAAEQGRFPRLDDRDDLWRLLVLLTARKALDLREHEARQKRGGGRVQDEAALADPGAHADDALARVIGREPTPELAALLAEEFERRMDQLGDAQLQCVALRKLEGYTDAEIAAELGCVERTVARRLRVIRSLWVQEGAP